MVSRWRTLEDASWMARQAVGEFFKRQFNSRVQLSERVRNFRPLDANCVQLLTTSARLQFTCPFCTST